MTRRRLNQYTFLLLLIGLGSALFIYWRAEPPRVDPLLGDPWASKKYSRELQMIGGKANVLAAEFEDWFEGLWQGESLARTVAFLTVVATLVLRFVARQSATTARTAEEKISRPDSSA